MPLYIGLMSGSSLDGIDAVLMQEGAAAAAADEALTLIAAVHQPFSARTHQLLWQVVRQAAQAQIDAAMVLAVALAEDFALAVRALLAKSGHTARDIAAIGCHGQTLCHAPSSGYTVQLNQSALLAERSGIAVVADFRARDIAAGGQGAPLACAFHAAAFSHLHQNRWVVNVGGMANVTRLFPGQLVVGHDSGPGNVLMDGWCQRHHGTAYDDDGRWAASGGVLPHFLRQLQAHPFFHKSPPKSCGREDFSLAWIDALSGSTMPTMRPQDVQATLLELTAWSISAAVGGGEALYLCGGGAHNRALRSRLQELLPEKTVHTTEELGIDPQWVEGAAFAWLAQRAMRGLPGNVPTVTGAAGARILGAIYPA